MYKIVLVIALVSISFGCATKKAKCDAYTNLDKDEPRETTI